MTQLPAGVGRRAVLGAVGAAALSACGGSSMSARGGPGGSSSADSPVGSTVTSTSTPELTASATADVATTTTVDKGSFSSPAMGRDVRYRVARPAGSADSLAVILGLHGFGGDCDSVMALGVSGVLDDRATAGKAPLAFVTVDGGTASYYHRRKDGTDAESMIVEELLPLLRSKGLDTSRLGLYGFSMGGYGALYLASRHTSLVEAVAVSSPALWVRPGDSPAAAFDSAEDFAQHSVWHTQSVWRKVPLSVSCGSSDPFRPATEVFVQRMQPAKVELDSGGHDSTYWSKHLPAQVEFLASRL